MIRDVLHEQYTCEFLSRCILAVVKRNKSHGRTPLNHNILEFFRLLFILGIKRVLSSTNTQCGRAKEDGEYLRDFQKFVDHLERPQLSPHSVSHFKLFTKINK